MGEENVTLVSIGNGAAVELFDRELERVLENIVDPNTEAEAVRKIKIEFVFQPGENRDKGAVLIKATSTLASLRPADSFIYIGRVKDGSLLAVEHNPKQLTLPSAAPSAPPSLATQSVPSNPVPSNVTSIERRQ